MYSSRPPSLPLRPEVQSYLRSCEYLLSVAAASPHMPFSEEERQLMNYYMAEMARMVDERAKV